MQGPLIKVGLQQRVELSDMSDVECRAHNSTEVGLVLNLSVEWIFLTLHSTLLFYLTKPRPSQLQEPQHNTQNRGLSAKSLW